MLSITNTKDLEKLITGTLKPLGFHKNGQNWYLQTDDCICMVNLQKSEWAGKYYINLAVCVTTLDHTTDTPLEYNCPIRRRLSEIVTNQSELTQALDFENRDVDSNARATIIATAIQSDAVPWLKTLSTLDGIKERVQMEDAADWWVVPALKQFLDIPIEPWRRQEE